MTNRSARAVVAVAVGASALAASLAAPAAAKGGHLGTTPATAVVRADRAAAVDKVAAGVDAEGKRSFSSTYGGVVVDQRTSTVTVYATDSRDGQRLARFADQHLAAIDTHVRIRPQLCDYSRRVLDAEADALMRQRTGRVTGRAAATARPVFTSVSVNTDASGITARVTGGTQQKLVARATEAAKAPGAAPVAVVSGPSITPATTSWRWNDSMPFIGGDVLLGRSWLSGHTARCTSGLAGEDSHGRDFLITAEHCFPGGAKVYGDGDAIGDFGPYDYGNFMGTVGTTSDKFDSEVVDVSRYGGAGTNSDEADQPHGKWYKVTSSAYSYVGDAVCQDGATSYYTGRGVPCGIVVTNEDVRYPILRADGATISVRGVQGRAPYACTQGDSGGLVFTVAGSTTRQARGQVSAIDSGNESVCYWTESPDILRALAVHLNPHT